MENISKINENLAKIAECEALIAKLKKENDDIYFSITQQYDKAPLEQLGLSQRTRNMLARHFNVSSYGTIADVIKKVIADIDEVNSVHVHTKTYSLGFGLNCWIELCQKLEEVGYSDDNTKTILKEHEVYHLGFPSRLVTMLVGNKIYTKEQIKRAYESGELMQIKCMCMFEQEIKEVIF